MRISQDRPPGPFRLPGSANPEPTRMWIGESQPLSRVAADVQAALTVIGRRNIQHDIQEVNLSGADLTGADLTAAS